MMISSTARAALIALVAFVGLSPASYADSGTVTLTIYKGGWIIGASGGSGSLYFRGRYYPLSTPERKCIGGPERKCIAGGEHEGPRYRGPSCFRVSIRRCGVERSLVY